MDNTQIRHSLCGNATGFYRISEVETLMELARADEREKMQGVEVWISVDTHREAIIEFYMNRPTPNSWIYNNLTDDNDRLIELLKLQSGECAKFKIVRCV